MSSRVLVVVCALVVAAQLVAAVSPLNRRFSRSARMPSVRPRLHGTETSIFSSVDIYVFPKGRWRVSDIVTCLVLGELFFSLPFLLSTPPSRWSFSSYHIFT